jgi:predicted RNase H-like nuclease (RuvC/YqgF family)
MQRLLTGEAKRTDGRLIKTNLHIEVGVSRATMNRATAVIADWDAAVGTESAPRDAQLVALQETVSKLKEAVTKLREENTTLKRKNQAAVTVIAELSAQLQSASGHEPAGTVTPLKKARTQRRHWRS